MRQCIHALLMTVTAVTLAACSDNTTDSKAPTFNEATSSRSMEAAKQAVLEQARPKADKSVPADSYIALNSGNQVMYTYLGLSGLPIDYRDIVGKVSREYNSTHDEFRKNDVLKAMQPQIDAAVAQAKAQRYFKIDISQPLGKYDFERNGFPVDSALWENGSYRYYHDNSSYRVSFTNGQAYRYLKDIPEDAARNIERLRNVYNGLHMVVYGFAQGVDTASTTVQTEIVKVEIVDSKGEVLASQ